MDILLLMLQVILGILFFWAFESHKYWANFSLRKWKADNLGLFVWSLVICLFFGAFLAIDPNTSAWVLERFVGVNAEQTEGMNGSGIITGILLGYATKRIGKGKKQGEEVADKDGGIENEQEGETERQKEDEA